MGGGSVEKLLKMKMYFLLGWNITDQGFSCVFISLPLQYVSKCLFANRSRLVTVPPCQWWCLNCYLPGGITEDNYTVLNCNLQHWWIKRFTFCWYFFLWIKTFEFWRKFPLIELCSWGSTRRWITNGSGNYLAPSRQQVIAWIKVV